MNTYEITRGTESYGTYEAPSPDAAIAGLGRDMCLTTEGMRARSVGPDELKVRRIHFGARCVLVQPFAGAQDVHYVRDSFDPTARTVVIRGGPRPGGGEWGLRTVSLDEVR